MASKEALLFEGSNLTGSSRTSLDSYLVYLDSQTDESSGLENLRTTVISAETSWFFLGKDYTDVDEEHFYKCDLIYKKLVLKIHQIGAVSEFKGREDRGYAAEDFTDVSTMATLCMAVFGALLDRLAALKDRHENKSVRLVKKILNTVCIKAFVLCAEHADEHLWTSEQSMSASDSLLGQILRSSECMTIVDFLNCQQDSRFHAVLLELKSRLSKSTWKINPAAKHVFSWCVFNVKSPQLGDQLSLVLPPMLLLVDDFQIDHKCLGVLLLQHLMDNTSRTELSWYGRAHVIFDALRQQMYTHNAKLVRMLHPCLLGILRVVEVSPVKCTAVRKENRYDEVLRQILTDMELEDKLVLRRAYVEHLPCLLEEMGITAVRHLVQLLRVISAYLEVYDGPQEICRLGTFAVLKAVILVTWPRMSVHCGDILQCLLKFIYDVSVDQGLTPDDVSTRLIMKAMECLQLLKCACPDVMQELVGKLEEITLNDTWDRCIKELLIA
ncbi:TELO2-interacting protein 2 [Lamellibrachia satsuma]|nr:TELO2-interacting protein 2 [Lamellibrachia satsuma]